MNNKQPNEGVTPAEFEHMESRVEEKKAPNTSAEAREDKLTLAQKRDLKETKEPIEVTEEEILSDVESAEAASQEEVTSFTRN